MMKGADDCIVQSLYHRVVVDLEVINITSYNGNFSTAMTILRIVS